MRTLFKVMMFFIEFSFYRMETNEDNKYSFNNIVGINR
jgi:hypothetical protein